MSAGRNPEAFFKRYAPFFEAVDRNANEIKTVLVIGANDGSLADPVGQCWRGHWQGVFVEPDGKRCSTLTANLIEQKRYDFDTKILCNIVTDGPASDTSLWRMTEEAADAYEKKVGDHGSALTSISRQHIKTRLEKHIPALCALRGVDSLIEEFTTAHVSIQKLLFDYTPDLVQIDTEGMDYEIMRGLLFCVRDVLTHKPRIVMYEHQHLSADNDMLITSFAGTLGYNVTRLRNDTLLEAK
jgi:FkbM family methyltransferase